MFTCFRILPIICTHRLTCTCFHTCAHTLTFTHTCAHTLFCTRILICSHTLILYFLYSPTCNPALACIRTPVCTNISMHSDSCLYLCSCSYLYFHLYWYLCSYLLCAVCVKIIKGNQYEWVKHWQDTEGILVLHWPVAHPVWTDQRW